MEPRLYLVSSFPTFDTRPRFAKEASRERYNPLQFCIVVKFVKATTVIAAYPGVIEHWLISTSSVFTAGRIMKIPRQRSAGSVRGWGFEPMRATRSILYTRRHCMLLLSSFGTWQIVQGLSACTAILARQAERKFPGYQRRLGRNWMQCDPEDQTRSFSAVNSLNIVIE